MTRILGALGTGLIVLWVVAHLLHLGPIQDVTGLVAAWLVGLTAAATVIAALTVLGCGLVLGRQRPAWLKFVRRARTVAAVMGAALVVVGLLHYFDTEPQNEIRWLVLGLAVLAGAGLVHGWLAFNERQL